MDKPRLAVVYDFGAASPTQIAKGLSDLADIVFAVPRSEHARSVLPLLELYGEVIDLGSALKRETSCGPVDGILTFSESRLSETARLAELLGVAFHSPDCVEALRNKERQRLLLAAPGVDQVLFRSAESPNGLAEAFDEVGYPAVVKPQRGQGSAHAYCVRGHEEAKQLTERFTNQWPAAGGEDAGTEPLAFIVEEFLRGTPMREGIGDYVSVESAIVGGAVTHLAITGKFALAPPFRETGQFWPPCVDQAVTQRIEALAARALEALGVQTGICHTEIKLSPTGPRIIEVNGRLGRLIAELAARACGIDLITLAGRIALGDAASDAASVAPLRPPRVHFQYHHASPAEYTSVVGVTGHRLVDALAGVDQYNRIPFPAAVSPVSTTIFDGLFGTVATHDQMMELIATADELLEFSFTGPNGIRTFSGTELRAQVLVTSLKKICGPGETLTP